MITDRRPARALERHGLARHYEKSDAWDITAKGRRLAKKFDAIKPRD